MHYITTLESKISESIFYGLIWSDFITTSNNQEYEFNMLNWGLFVIVFSMWVCAVIFGWWGMCAVTMVTELAALLNRQARAALLLKQDRIAFHCIWCTAKTHLLTSGSYIFLYLLSFKCHDYQIIFPFSKPWVFCSFQSNIHGQTLLCSGSAWTQ